MQDFTNGLIVIAIIALIGFACYLLLGNKTSRSDRGNNSTDIPTFIPTGAKPANTSSPDDEDDTTIRFSEWRLHQLDPKTGRSIKSVPVTIPSSGRFRIGRSKDCDFSLTPDASIEAQASRFHLDVGRDDTGFFAKDAGSANGTYIGNAPQTSSFDLVNEQVIWLGGYPIVFTTTGFDRSLQYTVGDAPRTELRFVPEDEPCTVHKPGSFHR